jgi:hypothetical protein
MRRCHSRLIVVIGLVAFAHGAPDTAVGAESEPVALLFQSPSGCGTQQQVLTRLQNLRGSAQEPSYHLEASVVVKRTSHGYELAYRAEKDAVHSRRRLVVADCAAVVEASALLLHLTLDPHLAALSGASAVFDSEHANGDVGTSLDEDKSRAIALRSERLSPKSELITTTTQQTSDTQDHPDGAKDAPLSPQAASRSTLQRPAVTARRPVQPDAAESDFNSTNDLPSLAEVFSYPWVGVGASVVSGVAPHWSIGPAVDAGLLFGGWAVQVSAAYHRIPAVPLADVERARLESDLLRVHVGGGPTWGSRVFQAGPILGFGIEHLSATPLGTSAPRSGASTWWSVLVGANLRAQVVSGLGLNWRIGALGSLERPKFTVDRVPGLVHQPSRFGWSTSLNVVWIWNTNP